MSDISMAKQTCKQDYLVHMDTMGCQTNLFFTMFSEPVFV